jgi:hypothetical protein
MIDENREDRGEWSDTESEQLNRDAAFEGASGRQGGGGDSGEQRRTEATPDRGGFTADELEASSRGRREEESGEVF